MTSLAFNPFNRSVNVIDSKIDFISGDDAPRRTWKINHRMKFKRSDCVCLFRQVKVETFFDLKCRIMSVAVVARRALCRRILLPTL